MTEESPTSYSYKYEISQDGNNWTRGDGRKVDQEVADSRLILIGKARGKFSRSLCHFGNIFPIRNALVTKVQYPEPTPCTLVTP